MYRLDKLSVNIGKKVLLKDISISFEQGLVHTIIGPNGAGKSTLLSTIAGLIPNFSGEILLDEINLRLHLPKKIAQRRAFMSQQPKTAFSFSVHEIVLMGRFPFFQSKPRKEDLEMVQKAMQWTGIEHLAERNSDSLSGGEIQRVHFARVLAQCLNQENKLKGKVLLLDEPCNNLDPKYQFELMQIVKKLSTDYGLTVIQVMHDLNLTAQVTDKIVLLNKGQLIDFDSPEKVLQTQQLEQVYEVAFTKMKFETGFYLCAGAIN